MYVAASVLAIALVGSACTTVTVNVTPCATPTPTVTPTPREDGMRWVPDEPEQPDMFPNVAPTAQSLPITGANG